MQRSTREKYRQVQIHHIQTFNIDIISTAFNHYVTLRPGSMRLIIYTGVKTGSMYKKPPEEERTNEYPDIVYPAHRRKRLASTSKPSPQKHSSNTFYADEHPEI